MKRKLLAVTITGLMAFGGTAAVAGAHHADGHDANYHGMCTAMFSGSEKGQENKQNNGQAFIVFRESVNNMDSDGDGYGDWDADQDGETDNNEMKQFCTDVTGGWGNPGQGGSGQENNGKGNGRTPSEG